MRLNEHTALSTPTILLVPYSEHHVPPYHEWMKDPELQEATASEPLGLEEEYAMQRSWRTDPDKLTFILCQPLDIAKTNDHASATSIRAKEDDPPERMIGDINLFLFRPDSEETEADVSNLGGNVVGELELMIAHKEMQQKGYGRAALVAFIDYILANWSVIAKEDVQQGKGDASEGKDLPALQLSFLRVKVKLNNAGSIRLFESVGFVRTVEEANYFGEVELRWLPDPVALRRQRGWERAIQLEYA